MQSVLFFIEGHVVIAKKCITIYEVMIETLIDLSGSKLIIKL